MTRNKGRPVPRPGILDIEAYVPGESGEPGKGPVFKLSSNETPLGPSPGAVKAYRDEAERLALYPDGSATALRAALGAQYGLKAERIVCGAGSDELLSLIAYAYLGPGEEAVYSEHGFLVYRLAILACGATPVAAPETNETANVDSILSCLNDKTRVIYIANPNNPTGTFLPIDEVRRLHASLPKNVLLVLDAAYAEYVRRNDYEAGIELVATNDNVVMTRTFSKVYGLAGLRLGWAYCPEHVADALNRIRGPFNVSGPAIAAGVAAVKDQGHVETAVAHNAEWLAWLTEKLSALGLRVTPSVANFVLMHFLDEPGKGAAAADAFLKARGLILRRVGNYGFPNALRMSVGTEEANRRALAALAEFLDAGARS